MKVIIAGGRTFSNASQLDKTLDYLFDDPTSTLEVVSGGAKGADSLGEEWARSWGLKITRFPADWNHHGHAAGVIRNTQMAEYADVLVAFWDGESKGTNHMIHEALRLGLEVHVYRYKGTNND